MRSKGKKLRDGPIGTACIRGQKPGPPWAAAAGPLGPLSIKDYLLRQLGFYCVSLLFRCP